MIVGIIIGLLIISFLWAYYAMIKESKAHGKVVRAKEELQKEKILFKL